MQPLHPRRSRAAQRNQLPADLVRRQPARAPPLVERIRMVLVAVGQRGRAQGLSHREAGRG